jgi:Restriction endonuclease
MHAIEPRTGRRSVAQISRKKVDSFLRRAAQSSTTSEQGRALEDLIEYIFIKIPGIQMVMRNSLNVFNTEEIDVAVWNNRHRLGLDFLPQVLIVECKNWSNPVGSQEVAYFAHRLENRGLDHGVLVAANGISGNPATMTGAHFEVAAALIRGQRILMLNRTELEVLSSTEQLVTLLKRKILELVVSGTSCV